MWIVLFFIDALRLQVTNAGFARKYPVFSIQDSECGCSCFLLTLCVCK